MFSKKKKIEKDSEAVISLNQDLIVHNMPKVSKLSDPYSTALSGSINRKEDQNQASHGLSRQPKSNFKAIGLVIIGSGLVAIGGLFYLSYRFIIAPTANPNRSDAPAIVENSNLATSTSPVNPIETVITTDLSTTTPAVVDLATTTVSTSEEIATSTNSSFPDADNDGLTDSEETLLSSSAALADTDSDGYSDFAEVISGYNPAGSGKISNNENLSNYINKAFNYEILYPKSWPIQSLNKDATVIFTTPDNSLIQISVSDNPDKSGILSWYEESFPGVTVGYDQVRSTYSWEGIMGENGLNFYLTDKKRTNIFVISYISATENRLAYSSIFQLMINSLFIK